MKKILVLLSLLMISTAGSAAAAVTAGVLATNVPTSGGAKGIYGGNSPTAAAASSTPAVKTSTGVNALVNFTAAAGASTGYVIGTKHTTGSKVFATANDATNIYWKQSTAATLAGTDVGTGSTSGLFSATVGWTSY